MQEHTPFIVPLFEFPVNLVFSAQAIEPREIYERKRHYFTINHDNYLKLNNISDCVHLIH